ncbi:MAG: hypothetical protein P4M09_01445 [Devosia sp.]|nr:hypothetical protein [Devosia sp.]
MCSICDIESFARGTVNGVLRMHDDGKGNVSYTVNTACLSGVPAIDRGAVTHRDGRNW